MNDHSRAQRQCFQKNTSAMRPLACHMGLVTVVFYLASLCESRAQYISEQWWVPRVTISVDVLSMTHPDTVAKLLQDKNQVC
ncbi:MAG: hypothetical protein HY360_25325 [Verrucomicrobia bacterium]|nr:hypothetical protein [Verrucomicrobiota bacterium]